MKLIAGNGKGQAMRRLIIDGQARPRNGAIVWVDGRSVTLSPEPFFLLTFFAVGTVTVGDCTQPAFYQPETVNKYVYRLKSLIKPISLTSARDMETSQKYGYVIDLNGDEIGFYYDRLIKHPDSRIARLFSSQRHNAQELFMGSLLSTPPAKVTDQKEVP